MGGRTSWLWAFLLAAVVGLSGGTALAKGHSIPKRPGPPKPLGTPKKPERLPALALLVSTGSRA